MMTASSSGEIPPSGRPTFRASWTISARRRRISRSKSARTNPFRARNTSRCATASTMSGRRLAVPAGPHDRVYPGDPGKPGEPRRVAPDAVERQVDEGSATRGPERGELLDDGRLVATQLPVVPAVRDVPERDRSVLVRQDPPQAGGVDRSENGLDVAHRGRV